MNENDFQPGDRVRIDGTVDTTYKIGTLCSIPVVVGVTRVWFDEDDLTLVERPEPTRTFELTRSQVAALANPQWDAKMAALHIDMLKKFDDEESN